MTIYYHIKQELDLLEHCNAGFKDPKDVSLHYTPLIAFYNILYYHLTILLLALHEMTLD